MTEIPFTPAGGDGPSANPGDAAGAQSYALLTYKTDNLGDEIQSVAAEQFLPTVDLRIDRDGLSLRPDGAPELSRIILNGWHGYAPELWPPGPFLSPLIASFHITREVYAANSGGLSPAEILVRGDSLRYLQAHGPIGARDLATLELLHRSGVDAYFSGCLTLTLGDRETLARSDYVCAVDLPEHLLLRLRSVSRSRIISRTHRVAPGGGFGERSHLARRRLSLYAQAKCVVTTRLHCALPCLAMGTPVILVQNAGDLYRFDGLQSLLHHCTPQDFIDGRVAYNFDDPPANLDDFVAYRNRLIESVTEFTGARALDRGVAPFPFKPERISERLLGPEPFVETRRQAESYAGSAFFRIFPSTREYKSDHRADFLRDVGRIHAESGSPKAAEPLLRMAHADRPHGAYISELLNLYGSTTAENATLEIPMSRGSERAFSQVVADVLYQRLTYLGVGKLRNLLNELTRVKARNVVGDFAEFGIALGGSGICIATQLDGARRYLGFDSFQMIPPPTEDDGTLAETRYQTISSGQTIGIEGDAYYGYVTDLYDTVVANFQRFGLRVDQRTIKLVRGFFQETFPEQDNFAIAVAHIDCDWYEQVKSCLDFVDARISKFGVIVVDDYNDWDGCKKAVDEFCSRRKDFLLTQTTPQAIMLRV